MKFSLIFGISILLIIAIALYRGDQTKDVLNSRPESLGLPQRIVPTTSDQIDFLSALIGPDRIVVIPEQALTWSRVADDETWKKLPTFSRFLAEPILAQQPDLVLVSPFAEPDGVARLRDSGIPMIELPVRKTVDDIIAALRKIAKAIGAEEKAEELIANMEMRRDALLLAQKDRPKSRALSYTNFGSGGWSAGSHTTIDTAMQLAGLVNVVGDRVGHFEFSFEELLALDPDYIIVSGAYGESGDTIDMMLKTDPNLAKVRAIVEDRILRIHPRLAAAGSQELILTAESLAAEVLRKTAGEVQK